MSKLGYIEPNDEKFAAQLETFKNNLGGYATVLGVTPAQVTAHAADTAYFSYALAAQKVMQHGAVQWTGWKDLVRDGGDATLAGAPVDPTLPATVPAVAPGVEVRFRAFAKQIKAAAGYNETIGRALGIEGPETVPVDLSTVQPRIAARVVGTWVQVDWGWEGHGADLDMIELEVDRGDGKGYGLLCYDTTPGYHDTAPQPAPPMRWKYRGIYRVADARVGRWSDEVNVNVGG